MPPPGRMDIFLAVGINDMHDALCLHDGINYWYPREQVKSGGGASIPGGIDFTGYPRGLHASQAKAPEGTKQIAMGVICEGASMNIIEANFRAIFTKLEQARQAFSGQPQGDSVYLWYRPAGATEFVYFCVADGIWTYRPMALPDGAPFKGGFLQLFVVPYSFGEPKLELASPTYQCGDPVNWYYHADIKGDVEAAGKVTVLDKTVDGSAIQRLRIGVRRGDPMLAAGFTPVYNPVPLAPGVATVDAKAWAASASRLAAATQNFQNIAKVTGHTGTNDNGVFDIWGPVKDTSNPLGTPGQPFTGVGAMTGGALPAGSYLALLTTHDGSGNESFPTAAVLETIPITVPPVTGGFFDGFEAGDFSLWDGQVYNFVGNGSQGVLTVDPAAAYPDDIPGSVLGMRAVAGFGNASGASPDSGGSWLYKRIPGGGTTGTMRFRLRINSDSGAGYNRIILCVDSTLKPLVWLESHGGGWNIQTAAMSGAPAMPLSPLAGIGIGNYLQCELRVSFAATFVTYEWYVNDVAQFAPVVKMTATNAPWAMAVGAQSWQDTGGGASGVSISVDFDDVQISNAAIGTNTGSVVYNWTAGRNGTGYDLYFQHNDGAFRKIDVGNVLTYTLISATAGVVAPAGPPFTPSNAQYSQLRLAFQMKGSSPLPYYTPPVSTLRGGGVNYELVRLGQGVSLPPIAPQLWGRPPQWEVLLQGRSGGLNTPDISVSSVFLFPTEESNIVITVPPEIALVTPCQFQIDVNAQGFATCQIWSLDGVTLIGQATCTGKLTLGPKDTILTVLPEVSDGAGNFIWNVNAAYQIQVAYTPRYEHWRGTE